MLHICSCGSLTTIDIALKNILQYLKFYATPDFPFEMFYFLFYFCFSSGNAADQDEDFVSDSYQASTSDIAEVDENMKKLVGRFFPYNI